MSLFKIFSKGADKPDLSEEKPKEDYTPMWWVETRHDGGFAVMRKTWYPVFWVYGATMVHDTKEVMKYSTLEEAVAFCEDQISKYEFKPEKVWGPKP